MKIDLQGQYGFSTAPQMLPDPGEGGPVPGLEHQQHILIDTVRRLSSKIGIGEGGVPA